MFRWRLALRAGFGIALAVGLASCAAAIARNPVPLGLETQASVVGMGSEPVRFCDDQIPPNAE